MRICLKNNSNKKILSISKSEWKSIGLKMKWVPLTAQVSKSKRREIETQIEFDMGMLNDICKESERKGLSGQALADEIKNRWIEKIQERVDTVDIPGNFILPENRDQVISNETNQVRSISISPTYSNRDIISTITREIHKIRRQQIDIDHPTLETQDTEEDQLMEAIQEIQSFPDFEEQEEVEEDYGIEEQLKSFPEDERVGLEKEVNFAIKELGIIRNKAEQSRLAGKRFLDFIRSEWISSVKNKKVDIEQLKKKLEKPMTTSEEENWKKFNESVDKEISKISKIILPENLSNDEIFREFKKRIVSIILPVEKMKSPKTKEVPVETEKREEEDTEDIDKRVVSDEVIQKEADNILTKVFSTISRDRKEDMIKELEFIYKGYSNYPKLDMNELSQKEKEAKLGIEEEEEEVKEEPKDKVERKRKRSKSITQRFFEKSLVGSLLKGIFRRSGYVQWARGDIKKLFELLSVRKTTTSPAR